MTIVHNSIAAALLLALTDPQVDHLIKLLESLMTMTSEGIKTLWFALSPLLLAYLAWRQAQNRKALDANTQVSEKAFEVANGHNEKIVTLTETVKEVAMKAIPQEVHITNTTADPVHTQQDKP